MRKTNTIEIEDEGRDKGKKFIITEMPPKKSTMWAAKVLFAFQNSGLDISGVGGGMPALASAGFGSINRLSTDVLEPILDELLSCVTVPAVGIGSRKLVFTEDGAGDDVEEIPTLGRLYVEAFKIHTDFLPPGVRLMLTSGWEDFKKKLSSAIQTSPLKSEP